jgi:hypothetical protein
MKRDSLGCPWIRVLHVGLGLEISVGRVQVEFADVS